MRCLPVGPLEDTLEAGLDVSPVTSLSRYPSTTLERWSEDGVPAGPCLIASLSGVLEARKETVVLLATALNLSLAP